MHPCRNKEWPVQLAMVRVLLAGRVLSDSIFSQLLVIVKDLVLGSGRSVAALYI